MRRTRGWLLPLLIACSCSYDEPDDLDLSTTEQYVIGNYSTLVTGMSPVGYWRLGDLSSSVMTDISGTNINGTYSDLYYLGYPGAIGGSIDTAVFMDQYNLMFTGTGTIPDHKAYSLTRDWDWFAGANFVDGTTWGTAPDGDNWICNLSCGSDYYRRGFNFAQILPASTPATYEQGRPTSLLGGEMQIRVSWSAHASGGVLQPVALVAQRQDANNYVFAELLESPSGQWVTLNLVKMTNSGATPLGTAIVGIYELGNVWILRFRFDGPTLKARAWIDGTPEPDVWQVEGTQSSAVSGTVAVRSSNSSGTVRPVIAFSEFWVQTLGFTVSMFVNVPSSQPYTKSQPFGKADDEDACCKQNDEYYFRYEADTRTFKGYVFNLEGRFGAGSSAAGIILDKWHHVVMSLDPGDYRDRSAGVTFYWDGRKMGGPQPGGSAANYYHLESCITACACTEPGAPCSDTCMVPNEPDPHPCWLITPLNGNRPVQIGDVGAPGFEFRGGFDELSIFSRKLTDQEVATLYNSSCQPLTSEFDEIGPITATASSYYGNDPQYAPGKAVDGLSYTRWSSHYNADNNYSNNQQITLDLGSQRDIARVKLVWEAAYASTYDLKISQNGIVFSQVRRVTKTNANPDFVDVFRTARYIRMQGVTRATPWGYSLWEFDVFPCDSVTP